MEAETERLASDERLRCALDPGGEDLGPLRHLSPRLGRERVTGHARCKTKFYEKRLHKNEKGKKRREFGSVALAAPPCPPPRGCIHSHSLVLYLWRPSSVTKSAPSPP